MRSSNIHQEIFFDQAKTETLTVSNVQKLSLTVRYHGKG